MCNRGQNTSLRLAISRPKEFLSERSEDLASDEASNEGRLVLAKESSLKVYCHPYSETPFYGHPYITDSSYIFSKLTREIWTQVNTDNGHFSVSRVTNSNIRSTAYLSDTDYLRIVSFFLNISHNYALIVDTVPCSNNDRFQRVNITIFLKKTVANQRDILLSSSFSSV